MQKVSVDLNNPYSHVPEENLIAVRSKALSDDVMLLQSVFPGRSGLLTSVINTHIKIIADYVRKHKLTYNDRTTVESFIRSGFTYSQTPGRNVGDREDNRPDVGRGTPVPHPKAPRDTVDIAIIPDNVPSEDVIPGGRRIKAKSKQTGKTGVEDQRL
jgi:hypothetical protein